MDNVSKYTTRVSDRREVVTYPDESGATAFIGMWVDGQQIAAAVRQDDEYAKRNGGAHWSLWSSGLRLRLLVDEQPEVNGIRCQPPAIASRPLPVRDQHDAQAWLALLADLAEHGPRVVSGRTH
ncbi:MAG TPA: hypothetical protein VJ777_19260 [Mycobacterium sp.]|nr:hypothetical protein [Mycobacterium sp.]